MMVEARCNAKILLKYTTVYPFRIPSTDMVCVFCGEAYSDPQNYREHMQAEHTQFIVNRAFFHTASNFEYLKVDCTEVKCRICKEPFEDLQSVAEHLVGKHGKSINLDAELGMQVFKLGEEKWVCAFCNVKVPSLRDLSRHTSRHYHKFTCEICGRSYINKEGLTKHIEIGHVDGKRCVKCKKMFPSCKARREHMEQSRRCWPNMCPFCGERFLTKKLKVEHLSVVHGEQQKASHTCPECGQVFEKWRAYRVHFVITHTEHNYECPFCGIKFDTLRSYESHKVVHTKDKSFPCTFCSKAFGRKKNLLQHMWIHSEHKRFECKMCNKQFNQKVSWKTHMKSYHPELVDF